MTKSKKEPEIMGTSIDDDERIAKIELELRESLHNFKLQIDKLQKNQLKRILTSVVESPLEETVRYVDAKEKKIAELGVHIKDLYTHLSIEALVQDAKARKLKGETNE